MSQLIKETVLEEGDERIKKRINVLLKVNVTRRTNQGVTVLGYDCRVSLDWI